MKNASLCISSILSILLCSAVALGKQQQSGTSQENNAPIYQVRVVGNSIVAISYQNRHEATEVGFEGTPLLAQAKGLAQVKSERGAVNIQAEFKNFVPAQRFGPEYLTYVLWAITPEGKANNLGEVLLDGGKSKIQVTSPLQTFGMIVTAEPYYAVNQPSNIVVLQNVPLKGRTTGTTEQITAKYELLERGQYTYDVPSQNRNVEETKSKVPLEVYEARNAVQIAEKTGAQQYASDALARAQASLNQAETLLTHKGDKKEIVQDARDAVQKAADARQITIVRITEAQAAQEKAAQAQREAQIQQEAEAKQKAEQAAREQAEHEAEQAQRQAEQARADAQRQAQQQQEAAAQAQREIQQQQQAAAEAQRQAEQARQEQQQLRASLLQQFNQILPTTDTPRGLKVNISGVLFRSGKADLTETAREALARLSGIIVAHPGLKMEVDGYTDNVGSDTMNQALSENRAMSVRSYLVQEGVKADSITTVGLGKSNPIADNATSEGRQLNRRVEILISGEIIALSTSK